MIKYHLPDRKLCMAVTEALSGLLSSSSKASSEVTTEGHCTYIHCESTLGAICYGVTVNTTCMQPIALHTLRIRSLDETYE